MDCVTNDTPRPGGGCFRLKFPVGGGASEAAGMSRISRTSFAVGIVVGSVQTMDRGEEHSKGDNRHLKSTTWWIEATLRLIT